MEKKKKERNRPADFKRNFAGNSEEMFRIGLAFAPKAIRLYAPFYSRFTNFIQYYIYMMGLLIMGLFIMGLSIMGLFIMGRFVMGLIIMIFFIVATVIGKALYNI